LLDDLNFAEFKDLFLEEAQGYIQSLNANLLAMEQSPSDMARVDAMFRAAHSLKGNAAMMGHVTLAELAHGVEDVLHKLRAGQWPLVPALADLLFSAIDQLQSLLEAIATDRPTSVDIMDSLETLRSYTPGMKLPPARPHAPGAPQPEPVEPAQATDRAEGVLGEPKRTIRVDVHHLDALLDVVTEMVIHRSLMERLGRRHKLPALNDALAVHERHLEQLRDAVLKMRMVPLSQIFDRFPRMVRDLLQAQQKEARFVIEGAEVEMDRMALEALGEPLVHLLRNAVDHGLETPDKRLAAGKDASGTLRLTAFRERDSVIIQVADDGRGMDAHGIAAAAVERQIIAADQTSEMSEEEMLALICHPGFSLRQEVTAVSGRGVGMNVVKRQVERLRGSLAITTQPGKGTTFRLRVPLKLSLMSAVLVRVGSETYALPTTAIDQIIEFDPQQIERLGEHEMLAVNGQVLPLQRLGVLLQVPDAAPEPRYALLVHHGEQALGLCVDAVEQYEEVVVKPLPDAIRDVPGLSGVTILGEGQTVLILEENVSR